MQIYQTKKEKILKIIQIVYDILSAVFIVFVSVALAIGSNKGEKGSTEHLTPTIQVVEHKTKSDLYIGELSTGTGYCILTESDFTSSNFILKFIETISSKPGFENFSYNVNSNASNYWASSSPSTALNAGIYISEGGTNSSNYYQVRSVAFSHTYQSDNQHKYDLYFYNNYTELTDSNLMIKFTYYVMKNLSVKPNGYTENAGPNVVLTHIDYTNNISGSYSSNGWYYFECVEGSRINALYETANNLYSNISPSYNAGYRAGLEVGYNQGLIAGSEGIETNAFTLIGQVFTSVSSFFNISVLPGLTIGVLLLVPAIITIVIVVIKMIKG